MGNGSPEFNRPMTQTNPQTDPALLALLGRIAEALERDRPPAPAATDLDAADAFVWHAAPPRLQPVPRVNAVALPLLKGIDRARDILIENTERFAAGLPPTMRCSGARAAWASPRS